MLKAISDLVQSGIAKTDQLYKSGSPEVMKNIGEFVADTSATSARPYEFLPEDIKKDLFRRTGKMNKVLGDYTKNIEPYTRSFHGLGWEDKYNLLSTIDRLGINDDITKAVFEKTLGEGAYNALKDVHTTAYLDPLVGGQFVLNEKHVPGLAGKARELDGLTANDIHAAVDPANVPIDSKAKRSRSGEDHTGLLKQLASDKKYNLYGASYDQLIKNLNDYVMLGREVDPETVRKITNAEGKTYFAPYLDDKGKPIPVYTQYGAESPYTKIVNTLVDNKDLPDQGRQSVEDMLAYFAGKTRNHPSQLEKVNTAMQYGALTNNVGTMIRSLPELLRTTATLGNLVDATKVIVKDKDARSALGGMASPFRMKSTEFGQKMIGENIIPDITDMSDATQKSIALLANSMQHLDDVGATALKPKLLEYFKLSGDKAETFRQKLVEETGVDLLDAIEEGVSEIDRAVARSHPANKRKMVSGGLGSTLRFIDQPLQEIGQNYHNIKEGYFGNDPEARRRANAGFRSAAAKGIAFGPLGVIGANFAEPLKALLPDEGDAEVDKTVAQLSQVGLINTPAAMLGMDTSKLVNPAIGDLPIVEGIPLLTTLQNLTGTGSAQTEAGRLRGQASGATATLGALMRLIAPNSVVTQAVSAINPSMAGRATLEGLRAVGLSPDSVAPGEYQLAQGLTKSQTLANLLGIATGTSSDYRDKVLNR